jgi:hypothetical protein
MLQFNQLFGSDRTNRDRCAAIARLIEAPTDNQSRSMGANSGIPAMNSIGAQPCETAVRKAV